MKFIIGTLAIICLLSHYSCRNKESKEKILLKSSGKNWIMYSSNGKTNLISRQGFRFYKDHTYFPFREKNGIEKGNDSDVLYCYYWYVDYKNQLHFSAPYQNYEVIEISNDIMKINNGENKYIFILQK